MGYRIIDIEEWPRRSTFEFFRDFEDPFFNLTASVDVTALYGFCKRKGLSFSLAGLFLSQQAVNSVPELRLRLIKETVVEFDEVHATQTILNADETFSFCYFENRDGIAEFDRDGRAAREKYSRLRTFDVEADRLDLVYYSVIPWVSFTGFKHASRIDGNRSVPRIVFGKKFEDAGRLKMPVSLECHHALVDGIHAGKYFDGFQHRLDLVD